MNMCSTIMGNGLTRLLTRIVRRPGAQKAKQADC